MHFVSRFWRIVLELHIQSPTIQESRDWEGGGEGGVCEENRGNDQNSSDAACAHTHMDVEYEYRDYWRTSDRLEAKSSA